MNNGELVVENGVGLVQLITSDKGSAEFTRCFENLLMYASCYGTFCSRRGRRLIRTTTLNTTIFRVGYNLVALRLLSQW